MSERLTAALGDRYRIERELGAGGMATVYLAEDLKHKRRVAVKVLKPELAAVLGAERFVQEITTTAALQHPNILPLFDSGEADGFLYYVMPFIDGETLRAKLDRETQLGVDEAVKIAGDVADALQYAHEHGVIHRDIKPENILLANGRPMVADFGIALAVSAAAGGRMTETGLSLGTPHYMSPEQATAEKEITARSDVYSLASVLYEMLTGEPPHMGNSVQQIIMKIITEPAAPVTRLRKSVPPNVADAVAKALEKLPADRFDSAAKFAEAIGDPHFSLGVRAAAVMGTTRWQRALIFTLSAALVVVTGIASWALLRADPPRPANWLALSFPELQQPDGIGAVAISNDGSKIVYSGRSTRSRGVSQLWVKSRDSILAVALAGTDAATSMAISPDGSSLVFIQGQSVRRLPISGGAYTTIAAGASAISGAITWLDDNSIIYVSQDQKLMRVPASSGTATVLWSSDSLVLSTLTPLPGARGVFFQACGASCGTSDLRVLDLRPKSTRVFQKDARAAYYVATGFLVVVGADARALAVPFDLKSLAARGNPGPVLDSVSIPGNSPYMAIASSGTLVMRRGEGPYAGDFDLVWIDRTGRETAVDSTFTFRVTQTAGNFGWALSPDGSRLALGRNTAEGDDIWIKSLPAGPARRLTFTAASEARPRWTGDGHFVTYIASDGGVYQRRADGSGSASVLWPHPANEAALSPDGRWLVFRAGAQSASPGGRDIFGVRVGGDTTPVPLAATRYDESSIAISPNGRWMAYQSDETGRPEVFVRPFPNTNDAKEQLSSGGGHAPLWSRDGRELFYLRGDSMMMAIPVTAGAEWRQGEPKTLFRIRKALAVLDPTFYTPWDVAPDGRFILARSIRTLRDETEPFIVVENWTDQLRSRMRR